MDQRRTVLEAAETLLNASPDRDISTRAVCEAAGISAPVLYRLFGDKTGLLRALVDFGFDRYLAGKRTAEATADPVTDLRAGWDSHIAFARAHPAVYRLMYSPAFTAVPDAAAEALQLLTDVLVRCAAAGLLATPVDSAAQTIMAANIGVALSLVTQPETYTDPGLSDRVRDAVHRAVLSPEAFPTASAADGDTDADRPGQSRAGRLVLAGNAAQLDTLLASAAAAAGDDGGRLPFTAAETALLREWLQRLAAEDHRAATS